MAPASEPFVKKHTTNSLFHRLDGSSIDVPFMRSRMDQFIAWHDGFKVLKLPIKCRDIATMLWAQIGGLCGGFRCASSFRTPETACRASWRSWCRRCRASWRSWCCWIRASCMTTCHDGTSALLSSCCPSSSYPSLPKSTVFSRTCGSMATPAWLLTRFSDGILEVDEEGTEVAASTAFFIKQCGTVMADTFPLDFIANHPFALFVVEELSGAVVFVGHVLDLVARSV
jgi:serpin B